VDHTMSGHFVRRHGKVTPTSRQTYGMRVPHGWEGTADWFRHRYR
jgi:hypothetical protein